MIQYIGLFYFFLLAIHIWALRSVLRSGQDRKGKLIWAIILLVPFIGALVWFLKGPKSAAK